MPLRIDVARDHYAAGADRRVDEAPSPAIIGSRWIG